jgi:hypothetical protein
VLLVFLLAELISIGASDIARLIDWALATAERWNETCALLDTFELQPETRVKRTTNFFIFSLVTP